MDGSGFVNPVKYAASESCSIFDLGITKRQLFAAMAMQGMLASNVGHKMGGRDNVALEAVRCADALIAKLSK